MKFKNYKRITLAILLTFILLMVGLAYGFVPLYKLFCQLTGYGGTTKVTDYSLNNYSLEKALPIIKISFNADVSDNIPWKFIPLQKELNIVPGQTALAFYSAENLSDKPIVGMATYNVTPQQAGAYFNKIQCFCFEQQLLEPHEVVEMPVFFYVDKKILEDENLKTITNITLSYTFFQSADN